MVADEGLTPLGCRVKANARLGNHCCIAATVEGPSPLRAQDHLLVIAPAGGDYMLESGPIALSAATWSPCLHSPATAARTVMMTPPVPNVLFLTRQRHLASADGSQARIPPVPSQ